MESPDRGLIVTELPFGLAGKVLRSRMPFSDFDPSGEAWRSYVDAGIDTVIVLADRQECIERAGMDLLAFYREKGLTVVNVPIPDHASPSDARALGAAVGRAVAAARAGSNLAIHCYAGIGRTGTFAAMMARHALGLGGREAIAWVRRAIPGALETEGQQAFVHEWDGAVGG